MFALFPPPPLSSQSLHPFGHSPAISFLRHSLLAVIFFVIPGVTGNLPTPKYTKSYASSTIAVTVFAAKRAHLRPKTLSLQEKYRSCTRKQAKQPQLCRTADGTMRRGSLRSVEMTEIVRSRRQCRDFLRHSLHFHSSSFPA